MIVVRFKVVVLCAPASTEQHCGTVPPRTITMALLAVLITAAFPAFPNALIFITTKIGVERCNVFQ